MNEQGSLVVQGDSRDDDRWFVVKGRRWRRTDPSLPEGIVATLTSQLGRGRSAVRSAKLSGDEAAEAEARRRVGLAKHGLGERGDYWWERSVEARLAQAEQAVRDLEAFDG